MEELNLMDFFKYYFSKIIIILIVAIFGFAISYVYTNEMQVPKYKSNTSLVLTRSNETGSITQTDISLNKNLVSTYREIIKSRRILSQVVENLGLKMSIEELSQQVNVTSANETELIVISVVDKDKKQARKIANEIATVFKEEIPNIYNIENISIIDKAETAKESYNVQPTKQYIIGTAGAFLIASIFVGILFYFDDTLKTAQDVEQKIELPVLATVPKYKKKKKNGKGV